MAIRNDLTRRAMRTFLIIVLIARVVKSAEPTSKCSYYFNATHAIISCTTSRMYTKANCAWTYERKPLNGRPPTHSESRSGAKIYYSTACSTSLKIESPGKHKVLLEFLKNQDINIAAMSKEIDIEVVTPTLAIARGDHHEAIESSIMVQQNWSVVLICTATGGNPQVRDLTFECQNERKNPNRMTEYSQTARIFITATANMDAKQCNCTAKQLSLYEGITKSVTIYRAQTPTLSIAREDSHEAIASTLVVKENENLVLICTSMGGDPPVKKLTFECLYERRISQNANTVRINVTVTANMDAMLCICSTKHISVSEEITESVTVYIAKTPTLSIERKDSHETIVSTLDVKENEKLVLICTSMGGYPPVKDLTFKCLPERRNPIRGISQNASTVRIDVTVTANEDAMRCICAAKHLSVNGEINKSVTIYTAKTPTLSIAREDTHEAIASTLFVKENENIVLICTSMGGNPPVEDLTFECYRERRTFIKEISGNSDAVRIQVRVTANMNAMRCTCSAKHLSVRGEITKTVTIYIAKKPDLPSVTSNAGIVINSMLIVENGEQFYLTCNVRGGTPRESNITLSCSQNGHRNYYKNIYGETNRLNIKINSRMDGQQCNCLANHMSSGNSFYSRTLTVKVIERPASPSCQNMFDKNNVHITCASSKVYPQGKCDWRCSEGCESSTETISESPLISLEPSSRYDSIYFSTTCTARLAIKHAATFKIQVSMYPDLIGLDSDEYKKFASVSENIYFSVGTATIDKFYINNYRYNYRSAEVVEAGELTHLTCTAEGKPLPTVMISHADTSGVPEFIKQTDAHKLEHTFYSSCNMTGLLMCSVYNILNRQNESRIINLKVKCKAEYETESATEPNFDAPVNADFNITLYIRVYPKPTRFTLFQGNLQMDRNNQIDFQYTNENLSLGEIKVKMKVLNDKGFGMYSLKVWNHRESVLNFTLKPRGPPLCPTDFTIQNISTNTLTITWTPGFDGGLRQTFSVSSYNPANNVSKSFQVEETSNDIMIYNVTGLTEGTMYVLSVDTENSAGKTQCLHVNVNGTTSALPSVSPAFITIVASSLTGFLLVLTLGIIAVISMRKRQCHQPVSFDVVWSSRIKFTQQKEHTVQNLLFNDASRSIAEEGDSTLNLGCVSTFKSLSTNAPGNPHFKIESAARGEIYANVVKIESDAAKNANNSAGVYNNTKSLKASGNDVKKSNIIAAMKHSKPRGQEGIDESGRTVNADGLTYVSVVVKPKDRKMKFGEGEEDTVRGPIDYAAIDLAATSKANREKMAKK